MHRIPPSRRDLVIGLLAAGALPSSGLAGPRGPAIDVRRWISRQLARRYGLRADENATFRHGWTLFRRMVHLRNSDLDRRALARLQRLADAEVAAAVSRLADAVAGAPSGRRGHHLVERRSTATPVVVFSDHHLTYTGHRTNFFGDSGNVGLYAEALGAYDRAGYTLVEDGDVEDLVIFDPAEEAGEALRRRNMTLAQLEARRLVVRLSQLDRILNDPNNAPYYDALRPLAASGRWLRVAGNHDDDLQRDEFLALLEARVPGALRPSDYVMLDRPDGSTAAVVMHGHQFDPSTNPAMGARFGETISETLGVYYQGPDRVWRWKEDGVEAWATGAAPFADELVRNRVKLMGELKHDLGNRRSQVRRLEDDCCPEDARRLMSVIFDDLGGSLFEQLFKKEIAFDYFEHRQPLRAFTQEVLRGERFFKYRLIDEVWLSDELAKAFPSADERPMLVLGHTHEPRFETLSRHDGQPVAYANSGAAGRFQNLIFGIEIVDGVGRMISWSRLRPDGPAERREWKTETRAGRRFVRASADARPLSETTARE